MQLTDNINLLEYTHSPTAIRRGINNQPDDKQIDWIRVKAELDQDTRDKANEILNPITGYDYKIEQSSGFRSKALNRRIPGSSKHSQHMALDHEAASDIKIYYRDNRGRKVYLATWDIVRIIAYYFPGRYDQIIRYPTFVHVSITTDGQNRGNIFKKVKGGYKRLSNKLGWLRSPAKRWGL